MERTLIDVLTELDCWPKDRPYTKTEAALDLICGTDSDEETVEKLCRRWKWTLGMVRSFLLGLGKRADFCNCPECRKHTTIH